MISPLANRSWRTIGAAALVASTALTPVPTLAQTPAPVTESAAETAGETVADEILVTARKREESLVDVPLSVSAFDARAIERSNFEDFTDVSKVSPGFFFSEIGSGRQDRAFRNYVIRGLNLPSAVGAADAVLLFVDGAPVISGELSGFDDIERIEILRGPQSAYFGRNTFAGAINVVTKSPDYDWGGRIGAEYATYDTSEVSLSVNGPIIADKLAFRLSGRYRDEGGQYRNPAGTPPRLGDRKTESVSLSVGGESGSGFSVKLYGEYSHYQDGPSANGKFLTPEFNCNAGAARFICGEVPTFPARLLGANAVLDDQFRRNVIQPFSIFDKPFIDEAGLEKKNVSTHAVMGYEFDNGISLDTITAYHNSKAQVVSDEDQRDSSGLPNPSFGLRPNVRPFINLLFLVERKFEDFSQEVRLTSDQDRPFRWTFGGNYVELETIQSAVAGETPTFVGFFSNTGLLKVKTPAVFGGLYYDLTDALTISAEGRQQWDRVSSSPSATVTLKKTFPSFSPRITLNYQPSDDLNVFTNWSRGYRPGTFNARFLTLPPAQVAEIQRQTGGQLVVDEEQIDNFELGVKGRVARRGTYSLVGYYGKLSDQQVQNVAQVVQANGSPLAISVTSNIGKSIFYGLEFEGTLALSDALSVSGSFAYNETEIKEFFCAVCVGITGSSNVKGNRIPQVPRYTANLSAVYTRPLAGDLEWFLRPEYSFVGSKFATEANVAETGERHLFNFRTGIESDAIRIEAFVTNLFNNKTPDNIQRAFDGFNFAAQAIAVSLPRKRQFGVRASYRF
jgi:iron complex outermembrane recepter protein